MHVRLGARGTSGESEERVVDYILVGSDAEIIRERLFLLASKDASSMNHSFFFTLILIYTIKRPLEIWFFNKLQGFFSNP